LAKDPEIWKRIWASESIPKTALTERQIDWFRRCHAQKGKEKGHFKSYPLDSYRGRVSCLTWYKGQLVTGSRETLVWNTDTDKHHPTVKLKGDSKVLCVDVFDDRLINGLANGKLIVWDPDATEKKKRKVAEIKTGGHPVPCLRVKDGKVFAVVQSGIALWDLNQKTCVSTFPDRNKPYSQIDLSENYVACVQRKILTIWDVRLQAQKPCWEFCEGGTYPNPAISVKLIGDQLFSGRYCGNLEVRDLRNASKAETKNPIHSKKDLSRPIGSIGAIEVDDRYLYTLESLGGRVSLWEKSTGEHIQQLDFVETKKFKTENKNCCLAANAEKIFAGVRTGGVRFADFSAD